MSSKLGITYILALEIRSRILIPLMNLNPNWLILHYAAYLPLVPANYSMQYVHELCWQPNNGGNPIILEISNTNTYIIETEIIYHASLSKIFFLDTSTDQLIIFLS